MARTTSTFTVTAAERVSPTIHRVRFQASDIAPFAESTHTDAYVKLVFGSSDETPTLRTYTVHSINAEDSTLAIDFVLHDDSTSQDGPHDSGVACTWAAEARPGDTIDARGPGGGYSPDPDARRHLICGDATAIPAIIAAVEALPNDAQADVIVEAPDYADVDLIPNHPGTTTTHVQPRVGDDAAPGDALVEMATAVVAKLFSHGDVDPETVQVFVHGEAHAVMKRIRPMLKDAGITVRGASISGYWRHGRTEEAFREWKKENKPD
ncbi:siderophore-interacting protein [uncultured Corynebacterium sp.]|uniref:siderophore-interacting protein n=1 Tax=uncultured Corynebacterium sp. TaxID=159447 RepID=UPI0025EE55F0|nr:siderophore-interacting protein [uncultured Corynebacterium sp.]